MSLHPHRAIEWTFTTRAVTKRTSQIVVSIYTAIPNDFTYSYSADFKTNEKKIMQGLDDLAK